MKHWLFILFSVLLLGACGGRGSGSGAVTSYNYQITGTSAVAFSDIAPLSSNFILKWNEDVSGNIIGVYTNQSTGETLSVTGTSNGSGREIVVTRTAPLNGISILKFIIAQTGDLSGSVNATLRAFDTNNVQVGSDESITVTATMAGDNPGGGDDGDNGTAGERFSTIANCNGAPHQVQAQIEVEIIPDETEFGFSANLEYSDNLPITFELTSVALTEPVQCVNTPCLKHTELQNGKWLNVIGWKEGSNFYLNLNYFNEDNYDVNITCSTTLMTAP